MKKLRLLIYNGDADACVPYVGNVEWIRGLDDEGVLMESKPWTPWFTDSTTSAPAGYATEYRVSSGGKDFSFATIRLAGHMTPTFQPEASFNMFERWLARESLPPSPSPEDCATRDTPSEDPSEQMCYLVQLNNYLYDIHHSQASGHPGYHNHLDYYLVALYKLGANASRLQAAFDQSQNLGSALPSTGFIDETNLVSHIGAAQRGDVATSSVHYSDYVDFFHGKIGELGEQATAEMALPHLVDGVAGDLFHAAIQLGYYYESGDPALLAEGLAWMATGYETLASLHPAPSYTDMRKAMADLHGDKRLPHGASVEDLTAQHTDVMAEYDLLISDAPTPAEVEAKVKEISMAVLELFAVDGYSSFFILHLCTGTRAMQVVLDQLDADPVSQAKYLRRHWSAVLYYYVGQGRPYVKSPAIGESFPSWPELSAATVDLADSHLAKLVYTSRENHQLWGEPLYQQVAARIVERFQSGKDWEFKVAAAGRHPLRWVVPAAVLTACAAAGVAVWNLRRKKLAGGADRGADASLGASLQPRA